MSRWTHAICAACYDRLYPGREPHRSKVVTSAERCCFCGQPTREGIYYRADPETTPCKGDHSN